MGRKPRSIIIAEIASICAALSAAATVSLIIITYPTSHKPIPRTCHLYYQTGHVFLLDTYDTSRAGKVYGNCTVLGDTIIIHKN